MSVADLFLTLIVVAGTAALTLGIIALIRIPNSYVKVHMMSMAIVLGPLVICLAALLTGQADLLLRALLVGGFLLVTTPVAAHRIIRLRKRQAETGSSVQPRP